MKKLLVANRGEIVLRVIRSAKKMGIKTVAVYSQADEGAPHVREADEAYLIGPSPPPMSYLNIDAVMDAVKKSGADAVHPGYGFLSENAGFAQAVSEAGAVWVGPPPDVLTRIQSKSYCRKLSHDTGIPVIPGSLGLVASPGEIQQCLDELGPPLLLKLDKGGGGQGIQPITERSDIEKIYEASRGMGKVAFDSPDCYLERKLEKTRHIEVQFVGDNHGNYVTLWERECSMQRRFQKVIEESPSPAISGDERVMLSDWTVKLARAMGYQNAGTVEFLRSREGGFHFMEINGRIQVEHPVTEFITGMDLVEMQLAAAAGETLTLSQGDVAMNGHSIQARVYAEDPVTFLPSPGTLHKLALPEIGNQKTRLDHALEEGMAVSPFYDPLLAKVVVWGSNRPRAINRLKRKLDQFYVEGVSCSIPLIRMILDSEPFSGGDFHTETLGALLDRS